MSIMSGGEMRLLELIRQDIEQLAERRREQVHEYAHRFRSTLLQGGSVAAIALCLVAAEQAANQDRSDP